MKVNFWRRQLLNRFSGSLLAFAVVLGTDAAPFDKTPPPRPQLSTSHGPIKSEGAIKEEIQGSIDVLLTDMPLTDAELQRAHQTRGVRLLHIATAVTAVVPCYNVGSLDKPLNFSSETLAAIFLRKITKWDDPAILALNPSVHLPSADIIVVGHAGEDGSTYVWTDFLSKTNTDWQRSVGRVRSLVALPALARADTAQALAELIRHTPNSITYTELWAAKRLNVQIGRVKNRSGNCIEPSSSSITAAALTASAEIRDDFRASITDSSGPNDYPIASFTWIIIPAKFGDSAKQSRVLSLLKWVLTDGQNAPDSMRLGRLPRSVAERELRLIESLQ